jgi:hypothetical protein
MSSPTMKMGLVTLISYYQLNLKKYNKMGRVDRSSMKVSPVEYLEIMD